MTADKSKSLRHAGKIGAFSLAMINMAIIYSVRGLPMMAEEGLAAVSYLAVSAVLFLIPTALIAAELGTTWPPHGPGGVYIWVREAFGKRMGFLAIWLQWSENVIWFPTALSFIAATLAYVFMPNLAENRVYMLTVILAVYWGGTLANFRGMKTSAWVSTIGVLSTMVITGLVVALGALWLFRGNPSAVNFCWHDIIPKFKSLDDVVFLAGVLVITSGLEVSAVHVGSVRNPARDVPRAILVAAIMSITAITFGSLAIAVVVPAKQISLVAGLMEAFRHFFRAYHMEWMVPVTAVLVVAGSIGEVAAWILGPSKGLLTTARDGVLPPVFQRTNRHGVPVTILLTQACIVSLLVLLFVFMPTVSSAYWILTALTAQLYLLMYLLMFAAVVVLRYRKPDVPRPYRIPGGHIGVWLVA
jgi:amino acid transporter